MSIIAKVHQALEECDIRIFPPKAIILPKKNVQKFLREVELSCSVPAKTIKTLSGFKFEGIRVISSEEVKEIEIV